MGARSVARKIGIGTTSVVAFLLVLLLGPAGPVAAQECGCRDVGEYRAPATVRPAAQDTSPGGGTFRLTTRQFNTTQVTLSLTRTSNNALVQEFVIPIGRAAWGFSPDGNRFMYRHAFNGNSATLDYMALYDLAADRRVHETSVPSGAAVAFSPHGKWFMVNALYGPGEAQISIVNAVSGEGVLDTSLIFRSAPGDPGDTFGVMGLGFSPEAANRSFMWAYRTTNGSIQLTVRNLATGVNVVDTPYRGTGFWKFSRCGDVFGTVQQYTQTSVAVRLYKTAASNQFVGTERTFSPIPASIKLTNTLEQHQVVTTNSSGVSTTTNIGSNTADDVCAPAPALDRVVLNPTTVVGGQQNSAGTVHLTADAASSYVVNLESSDTSAATVPSSVTVAAGTPSHGFTVSTRQVSTTKTVTITARNEAQNITKTAVLTVNPPPATAPRVASLTVDPARVAGGGPSQGTVTLDVPAAGPNGTPVTLLSSNPAAASVEASTTVLPNQTTKTFAIQTSAVASETAVTITATAGGQSRTAVLTVLAPQGGGSPEAVVQDPACRAEVLGRNDDGSTGAISLPFAVNLFGTTRDFLFVNNNGNVTFEAPLGTYTPFQLTADTPPIIAPFFADVDTRGAGSDLVRFSATAGPVTFNGRPAFCVNWVDVGYFAAHTDKTNSFQLLLVDRSDAAPGDFDIVMNYDRISWETGDASGGRGGLGGTSAGAGYSAGTGDPNHFFQFPGSLVNGALLDSNAATGLTRTSRGTLQLGRHIFEVRNGDAPVGGTLTGLVTDNAQPPRALAGAPVQVCPAGGGQCRAVTLTGATGRYQATGLPAGDYMVTASAPSGSTLSRNTAGPVTVTAGATATQNVVLSGPIGPPDTTTVSPASTNGQGIPSINWRDAIDLDHRACPAGTATYEIRQNGTVIASGPMSEAPVGMYTAHIPPLYPRSGPAEIVISVDCPDGTPDEQTRFDIYIDPSGFVLELDGTPLAGVTVTLYRSDTPAGPFEPVLDGSAVMSPANRSNPDLTDADGHFGWDVIAGFYRVRAERAGCTAPDGAPFAETAVLEIPPPVTDLDIRLDCGHPDVPVDSDPPTVAATPSPAPNAAGWNNGPVTVSIQATDAGEGASGVRDVTYKVGAGPQQTVAGDRAEATVEAEGETVVEFFATDEAGNQSASQTITVRIDRTAPAIQCAATPNVLRPPNHKMHDIRVTVSVSDALSGAAGHRLTGVASNEPDNGLGDGDTATDVAGWDIGQPDTDGQLRAERSGRGTGRTYTLTYEGTDAAGNGATCTTTVVVPHDNGRR